MEKPLDSGGNSEDRTDVSPPTSLAGLGQPAQRCLHRHQPVSSLAWALEVERTQGKKPRLEMVTVIPGG